MRCFFAINIPLEIKKYISDIISQLKKQNPRIKIKWVEPENIHLTLAFLGEITDAQAKQLSTSLSSITFKPFTVSLSGVSAFPNINQPRVLKIGLIDETGRLCRIAASIRQSLSKFQLSFDDKPFSSHITLGRVRDSETRVNLKIAIKPFSFLITSIDLMKSQLTPTCPIYTKINNDQCSISNAK